MFKKYIQDIAKHETRKILLSNYKEKLNFEIKQKRELEENRRIKSQLSNNVYFNMYQKQVEHTELLVKEKEKEISELKKELLDSKNGLNGAKDIIKNMKQENLKLKEENSKSKLLSIGNDYEKQVLENKLSRIYKTIEENYYQDGYYELLRIKNTIVEILKES